jgi:quinol monooxygenase YgiN
MSRYALFGKLQAHPGQGDALAGLLLGSGGASMPGCLLYVINRSPEDPDALYVYEAWESKEAHGASLELEAVRTTIQLAMPLIAGFSDRVELLPVGGQGLPGSQA